MNRPLTAGERRKYLYDGHALCPYCGASVITGDSVEIVRQGAWQVVSCQNCGRRWTDIYRLCDIKEYTTQGG